MMSLHKAEEEQFFFSYMNPDMKALEWGCGESTLDIASRVKSVVSIEHNLDWHNRIKSQGRSNITMILKPTFTPYEWDKSADGNLSQFGAYVFAPLELGNDPYDLIFIDGRARLYCAEFCLAFCHPETLIFFHDFKPEWPGRECYAQAYRVMDLVRQVYDMALLKPKESLCRHKARTA